MKTGAAGHSVCCHKGNHNMLQSSILMNWKEQDLTEAPEDCFSASRWVTVIEIKNNF